MTLVRATRTVATAIVAVGAVLSQPALAADCSAIEAIAAAKPGGFESIKGEPRKIGLMTYTYLLTVSPDIAGFANQDCRIRPYSSTVEMSCTATLESEDALARAFETAATDIDRCLVRKGSSVTSVVKRSITYAAPGAGDGDFYLGTRRTNGGGLQLYFEITKVGR